MEDEWRISKTGIFNIFKGYYMKVQNNFFLNENMADNINGK